jgi:uncharacterized repeat protein (TIGR03843 family)
MAAEVDELLTHGQLDLEGRLVDASNTTLRAVITLADVTARCVYKPVAGERPLWDFPDGTLAGRELAAFLVSESAGWGIVPPTVLRDGPLGPGMCQLWIEEDLQTEPVLGWFPTAEVPDGWRRIMVAADEDGQEYQFAHADDPALARLALFDVVVNNADRKGGHVIRTRDQRVYGIDHGLCFNVANKIRTVLWGWAGQCLPAGDLETLRGLAADFATTLAPTLASHLDQGEVLRVRGRIGRLLTTGRFPAPRDDHPAVPWPPM